MFDKFPRLNLSKSIFFAAIVFNLIFLDWVIFSEISKSSILLSNQQEKPIIEVTNMPTVTINIQPTVTPFEKQTVKLEDARPKSLREVYIPIGSGSTTKDSWDPLTGVEVAIDTQKTGNIKEVYFQGILRIPTGNGKISAKLFNITDNHDVWFSEISNEGSNGVLKEAKITLDKGSKLYRVYLKSSLQYEAIIDLAKIKLIIEE